MKGIPFLEVQFKNQQNRAKINHLTARQFVAVKIRVRVFARRVKIEKRIIVKILLFSGGYLCKIAF